MVLTLRVSRAYWACIKLRVASEPGMSMACALPQGLAHVLSKPEPNESERL